ncbi:MAG: PPC domain-containing protein, partial [Verrucomicrobiota bacterium]
MNSFQNLSRETATVLRRRQTVRITVLTLCCAFVNLCLVAQPVPKLTSISPEWVQRGVTVDVVLSGENLLPLSEFAFGGDDTLSAQAGPPAKPTVRLEASGGNLFAAGLASDSKRVAARLSVASETTLGLHEVRVITPSGVSNPLTIRVTDTPEIIEKGGKHSLADAQEIELPVGLLGKIGEADQTDFLKFKGRKGEHLIFDVQASRVGSALDSSLAVLDSTGKELIRSEDFFGADSWIDFPVPADGIYFVTLRDFQHRGGDAYSYHLTAGAIPYLESIFPFGGQLGKAVELTLGGRNLEGAEKMSVMIDTKAPTGPQEVRAHTDHGYSNPRSFDVSVSPNFLEVEANNAATNANEITVPININGHIQAERDSDVFKFKIEKGQRFIFEVFASRFGSRLDPLLVLSDAKGSVLQQNDDAAGADARIDATFPDAGEYFLSVRDLLERGGENFGYRISIGPPPKADFSAKLLADTLRISRSGRTIVRIEATRTGFAGAVEILCHDLPKGISCSELVIPPEFPGGLLEITAADDAELGTTPLQLSAVAVIDGMKVSRPLQLVSGAKPAKLDKKGRSQKTKERIVSSAYLTVLEAAPFSVDWITLSSAAEQNQSATVVANVERRNGFADEIKLSIEGFSSANEPIAKSIDVPAVTLKTNSSRAEFQMSARLDGESGSRPIFVRAESGSNVEQFSRFMDFKISEFPFVLSTSLPRLGMTALRPGQT